MSISFLLPLGWRRYFAENAFHEDMTVNLFRAALTACAIALVASPAIATSAAPETQQTPSAEQKRAQLIQYSNETDLKALSQSGKTVVFFFATWCPNCILTLTELSEKWSELDPELTLVIADYDTEVDLKAQYGVSFQDTFVLLTKEGAVQKRWNAGGVEGVNKNLAEL
jgi:thiol-disulfide isomerase/thioredoxin